MSFSSDVKSELNKIIEATEKYKNFFLLGKNYGVKKKETGSIKPLRDEETGVFLRGVFIACGTVSNPEKEYHLELNINDEKKQKELYELITESGIEIKKSTRKGKPILYIKDSEMISDFLTFIGAGSHSMEIMNAKIYKEMRNNVNRAVNCEAANIGKTARAAGKQIADIEFIYKQKGEEYLPPELKQIADLRLNNIEMSLKEIGEACGPRLSRSGVFHRLEKICKIAKKLRTEK